MELYTPEEVSAELTDDMREAARVLLYVSGRPQCRGLVELQTAALWLGAKLKADGVDMRDAVQLVERLCKTALVVGVPKAGAYLWNVWRTRDRELGTAGVLERIDGELAGGPRE